MNERARALAEAVLAAIAADREIDDPFAPPLVQPTAVALLSTATTDRALTQESNNDNDPLLSKHSAGFFVGMERYSQFGLTETFLHSSELMVTKSFIVIGATYNQKLWSHFLLDISARGGAMPLEFLRPLEKNATHTKISKMLDVAASASAIIPLASLFQFHVGVYLTGLYFDSDIDARIPEAPMSTYWQFKEGITASADVFLRVFDMRIAVFSALFPFIQNSAIGSMKPFNDYGWLIGLDAESTVYRSFGLKFLAQHHREFFDAVVAQKPLRVVSSGTLAYLGFVGRF